MFAAAQNSGFLRGLCIQEKTGHVNHTIASQLLQVKYYHRKDAVIFYETRGEKYYFKIQLIHVSKIRQILISNSEDLERQYYDFV